MDWMQFLTLISTMIATGYTLHSLLRSDIKEFRQELKQDMLALDERFDRRMLAIEERFDRRMEMYETERSLFNERVRQTDEKWERLFERLLAQDKAKA